MSRSFDLCARNTLREVLVLTRSFRDRLFELYYGLSKSFEMGREQAFLHPSPTRSISATHGNQQATHLSKMLTTSRMHVCSLDMKLVQTQFTSTQAINTGVPLRSLMHKSTDITPANKQAVTPTSQHASAPCRRYRGSWRNRSRCEFAKNYRVGEAG
jgi:hypothetical protein